MARGKNDGDCDDMIIDEVSMTMTCWWWRFETSVEQNVMAGRRLRSNWFAIFHHHFTIEANPFAFSVLPTHTHTTKPSHFTHNFTSCFHSAFIWSTLKGNSHHIPNILGLNSFRHDRLICGKENYNELNPPFGVGAGKTGFNELFRLVVYYSTPWH